jgi:hypothetical protein
MFDWKTYFSLAKNGFPNFLVAILQLLTRISLFNVAVNQLDFLRLNIN